MLVVTGATGNTGSIVLRKLMARQPHREVIAFVRSSSQTAFLRELGVTVHVCDLQRPESYLSVVPPDATFLEIANLRHAQAMLPHLRKAGISRAYCVTTTAVFSNYHSYGVLYRQIEAELLQSGVPTTLLRPSMIYGNERDANMHKLIRVLRHAPAFPVFGPGTALMQPVFVDDLAEGIVEAVIRGVYGEYNLAGPVPLSYRTLLQTTMEAIGRRIPLINLEHRLAATIARGLQRLPGFPVKHEQVMRLMEDKAFDISAAQRDIAYQPRPFADGIAEEALRLREIGWI